MIKGSVSLVTGGASGLGKATAELLIQRGGSVIICDLPSSNGKEVVKTLGEDKCTFVPTDVTLEDDVQNLISIINNKYGKLDYVVNCAGIMAAMKTYNSKTNKPHDLKVFSKVLNVNALGTFNVVRLAVGLMNKNKPNQDGERGVIINTSSVAAFEGQIGSVAYSASKGAIVGMTLPLARELAEFGIRVCTIAPGLFQTSLTDPLRGTTVMSSLMKCIVFPQRYGNPNEYAKLVESVIENPMLNGEVIRLDAGIRVQAGKL